MGRGGTGLAWDAEEESSRSQGEDLQQAELSCPGEGLGPAVDAELAVDVLDVLLGRGDRDHEPVGDLSVREPFADESQHFELALGERLDERDRRKGVSGRRRLRLLTASGETPPSQS